MIPVDQRQNTDCARAAIASVLELAYEDVPHFFEDTKGEQDKFWNAIHTWLWQRGILLVELPPHVEPCCYHLATGPKVGCKEHDHMVVMFKGEIVHDPDIDPFKGAAKNNPMRQGIEVKHLFVLAPIDMGQWS